jgi:hypothetical protein
MIKYVYTVVVGVCVFILTFFTIAVSASYALEEALVRTDKFFAPLLFSLAIGAVFHYGAGKNKTSKKLQDFLHTPLTAIIISLILIVIIVVFAIMGGVSYGEGTFFLLVFIIYFFFASVILSLILAALLIFLNPAKIAVLFVFATIIYGAYIGLMLVDVFCHASDGECYAKKAVVSNNLSLCYKANYNSVGSCFSSAAVIKRDINICLYGPAYYRDHCYYRYAVATQDPQLCRNIRKNKYNEERGLDPFEYSRSCCREAYGLGKYQTLSAEQDNACGLLKD